MMSILAGIDPASFMTGLLLGFTICVLSLAACFKWMGE